MSALPGVNSAYTDESPNLASREQVQGAPWQSDWRDIYPIASDQIRNHCQPAFLGVLDATESVSDWNPYEGTTYPRHPLRFGYGDGAETLQVRRLPSPLAIDSFDRHTDHGQQVLSGISSIAALVPFLELPDAGIGTNDLGATGIYPYHFDTGGQLDMASAIGPRQIFREPASYGDQTAAIYAAGFDAEGY